MAKNALHTIRREANRIRKDHPKMSYQSALKKAGKEYTQSKISGTKKKKAKKRSGKRKSVGAKPKYYAREVHEVRRVGAISYTGGKVKISGTEIDQTKKRYRHEIAEQMAWLEVLKSEQTTKAAKTKIQKKINEKRAELNRIK